MCSSDLADVIVMLDDISDQLEQLKSFSFLSQPLPLINKSVSDILDFTGDIARMVLDLSQGDASTIETLESDLEEILGITDGSAAADLINLTVDTINPKRTRDGASGVKAEFSFDPAGLNNALKFTAAAAGTAANAYQISFIDDGTIADSSARAAWDAASGVLTVRFHSGVTTAGNILTAVNNLPGASHVFDVQPVDAATTGAVTAFTALKLELNYELAYGNFLDFSLNIDDLLDLLPPDDPAQILLSGDRKSTRLNSSH